MHIEKLIQGGQLKPGDRLPAERELARHIKVSRPSVRAGLRSLAAVGVVESRHGAGSFITAGPPKLSTGPLSLMAALHGFTRDDMFDARRVLEVAAAGLAAERANGDNLATMSEEIAGMFASLQDPQPFLVHDVRFHRAIALASHNPVLAALVEMLSTMVYERRRLTVERARGTSGIGGHAPRIYAASATRQRSRRTDEQAPRPRAPGPGLGRSDPPARDGGRPPENLNIPACAPRTSSSTRATSTARMRSTSATLPTSVSWRRTASWKAPGSLTNGRATSDGGRRARPAAHVIGFGLGRIKRHARPVPPPPSPRAALALPREGHPDMARVRSHAGGTLGQGG